MLLIADSPSIVNVLPNKIRQVCIPKRYLFYKDDLVEKVFAIREKGRNRWHPYQSASESRKFQHKSSSDRVFFKKNHILLKEKVCFLEKHTSPQ